MKALRGAVALTRPVNMAICAVSVISGGLAAGRPLDLIADFFTRTVAEGVSENALRLIAASVSASLILAAGNAFNDVMDVDADRINAPHRPIPSGTVSRAFASWLSVALVLAGMCLAAPLGVTGTAVAFAAALILFVYDVRLKRTPLAGNVSVALLGGLAFVYGGIATGGVSRALVPAVFAFLLHLGRELIKDAEDAVGDRAAGMATAATLWGERTALRIAAGVLTVLIIVTAVPFVAGYFGLGYGLIVLTGVWPAARYGIRLAYKAPDRIRMKKASLYLKLAMPAGIIAVLAGFQGL